MKCKICDKESNVLSGIILHVSKMHGLTSKKYYDLYFRKESEGFCLVCGKETRFDRFKYSLYCLGCSNKDICVKEKKKITLINNYGVDNPLKSKIIFDKIKQTCLNKYGSENPIQSSVIKDKIKQTCLNKYGTENVFQNKLIRQKYKETCLKKYGVDNPFRLKKIKYKIIETNLKKYGFYNPFQNVDIQRKSKITCLKKYGVDNYGKTPMHSYRMREWMLSIISKQYFNGEPPIPHIGEDERCCLDELEKKSNYKIIRNDQHLSYYPDGYVPDLKLFIEFDERHHFIDDFKTYIEKDISRELELASLGCIIYRIKLNDWKINKRLEIEKFLKLVELII